MLAFITEETLNEWKNSPEQKRDDLAVRIGRYMREHNVSRKQAIKILGVQDPQLLN